MLPCRSRISYRLRGCDLHLPLSLRFRHYSSQIVHLSFPWPLKSCSGGVTIAQKQNKMLSCSSIPSKSRGEIPILFECFSQREGDHEIISEGLSPVAGGIVALGKFDALHIGHRELAIQASKAGPPFLVSFTGMAEVLGWEYRAPVVAKCDRKRVLSSWAPYCDNLVPKEFEIEFLSVRHLTPQQFVEKLSKELRVRGVVAGENYRFGYKAAGDASDLVKLSEEYGMEAYIINSVMDKNRYPANIYSSNSKDKGQVSSTRVRHALAVGDMNYVSQLLGRRHRLILMATGQDGFIVGPRKISAPKSCLLNLAPKEGLYEKCFLSIDQENVAQCRVVIDMKFVHVEIVDVGLDDIFGTQNSKLLQIEFGDSSS
ncbi:hypothetical protein L6164_026206 [Bauhinia variegata]|uniref:Uncharacterized protein n=1 Tax=Bauhinia variegata TaxID=167791 RepID=A0ACB9LP23_BAUVA|nr:hypothetical protein L6164_026206 [Bauhinia variegata]